VEGIGKLLAGSYSAPTESAMEALLSRALLPPDITPSLSPPERELSRMAEEALLLAGARNALMVGQAEPDKNGGKGVWVVFASADGTVQTQRISVRESGEIHRTNLVTQILDWLRRMK
jgi:hypothetical protein